jgi:transcriptional regulator with XRE-family HTH domain
MIDQARAKFGQHVARLRRGQRLTREQLAILADLKPVTVKNMELGRFNVPFDVINRVAVVLGGEIKIVLNNTNE